jgi:hypothetical protein
MKTSLMQALQLLSNSYANLSLIPLDAKYSSVKIIEFTTLRNILRKYIMQQNYKRNF